MKCRICESDKDIQAFNIREMMFDTNETFTYFECLSCGCLQISEVPHDMSKYYPQDYYQFDQPKIKKYIYIKNFFGKIVEPIRRAARISRYDTWPFYLYELIKNTDINYGSRILEVGCGRGNLLKTLKARGFNNICGIDPYIGKEFISDDIKIFKNMIHSLPDNQKFDLIIFDHSFEHIPDQMEVLAKVFRILSDGGGCLIRMPVKTEFIWNRYGTNWVQIDAPRHFFLHTLNSFELLAKKCRLSIQNIIFDSTEFQFLGSEQYERNIALRAYNSYYVDPNKCVFTEMQMNYFKKLAAKLNKQKQGDQAAFFLKKESEGMR